MVLLGTVEAEFNKYLTCINRLLPAPMYKELTYVKRKMLFTHLPPERSED